MSALPPIADIPRFKTVPITIMAAYRSKRSLQRIYSLPRISQSNFYAAGHKDQTPPVDGFWSLTLYDAKHFFVPNEIKRYSLGTKNKTSKYNPDGSLTIYVQADPPPEAQRANWLPTPKNADFSLFMRAYWPKTAVIDGSWTPPAVQRIEGTVGRQ